MGEEASVGREGWVGGGGGVALPHPSAKARTDGAPGWGWVVVERGLLFPPVREGADGWAPGLGGLGRAFGSCSERKDAPNVHKWAIRG